MTLYWFLSQLESGLTVYESESHLKNQQIFDPRPHPHQNLVKTQLGLMTRSVMMKTTTLNANGMVEIVALKRIQIRIGMIFVKNAYALVQWACKGLRSWFRISFHEQSIHFIFAMMLFLVLFSWPNCALAEIKDYHSKYYLIHS